MKFIIIIILLTFTSTLAFAHLSEEQQAKITNITTGNLNNTSKEQSSSAEIPAVKSKNIPIQFPEESSPEDRKEAVSEGKSKLESGSVVVEKVQSNETEIEAGKRECNKTETEGGKHKLGWRPYRDCDYDDYDYPNYPNPNPYPYPYPLPLPLLPPFGDACQFDYQCTAILKRTDGICARIPGKPNMCACPFGYRMVSNSYLGAVMGCQKWENCDNDCQFDASLGIDSNMKCDYDMMRCVCKYYYSSNGWRCV